MDCVTTVYSVMGWENCDVNLGCQASPALDCNDGVGCTIDSCNETLQSCEHSPEDANCDNGLFCDGIEVCDTLLDCQLGNDPCPGQPCDEASDACTGCLLDSDCDDGLFCNGIEFCDASGTCQTGSAVVCDDGVNLYGRFMRRIGRMYVITLSSDAKLRRRPVLQRK